MFVPIFSRLVREIGCNSIFLFVFVCFFYGFLERFCSIALWMSPLSYRRQLGTHFKSLGYFLFQFRLWHHVSFTLTSLIKWFCRTGFKIAILHRFLFGEVKQTRRRTYKKQRSGTNTKTVFRVDNILQIKTVVHFQLGA